MSLRDSILSYEREWGYTSFRTTTSWGQKLSDLLNNGLISRLLVEHHVAVSEVCLDKAFDLRGAEISTQELESLMQITGVLDNMFYNSLGIDTPVTKLNDELLGIERDLIKETVVFYQKLVPQEGTAGSYAEAVKNVFGTEEAYKEALDPMKKLIVRRYEILMEVLPQYRGRLRSDLEATLNTGGNMIRKPFLEPT